VRMREKMNRAQCRLRVNRNRAFWLQRIPMSAMLPITTKELRRRDWSRWALADPSGARGSEATRMQGMTSGFALLTTKPAHAPARPRYLSGNGTPPGGIT
jgi:hypothetical protein